MAKGPDRRVWWMTGGTGIKTAVTRHFTILRPRSSKKWSAESFIEPKVSMAIGRTVYAEGMSFPGSSEFGHLSTYTGCGSDIRVCQGAQLSRSIPTTSLSAMEFVSSHPSVYHLDVLGWLVPSLQACPLTPGLESADRSVADAWLSCSELVCRQGHTVREHPPTLHDGMCEGHQGPDRDGVLQPHVSPHHLTWAHMMLFMERQQQIPAVRS